MSRPASPPPLFGQALIFLLFTALDTCGSCTCPAPAHVRGSGTGQCDSASEPVPYIDHCAYTRTHTCSTHTRTPDGHAPFGALNASQQSPPRAMRLCDVRGHDTEWHRCARRLRADVKAHIRGACDARVRAQRGLGSTRPSTPLHPVALQHLCWRAHIIHHHP